jgi:hypothetical protein
VLARRAERGRVRAGDLVTVLLGSLAPIWPGEISIAGENLGDAWLHAALGTGAGAVVPFHKLTQWLAYSLVEPLAEGGLDVIGGSELTGLADYRNGGLLLDAGVLSLRAGEDAGASRACGDEIVVEWRALTVALFDELAPRVASRVGARLDEMKPGAIECLTWSAGRKIAFEKRPNGDPPLALERDGTFF